MRDDSTDELDDTLKQLLMSGQSLAEVLLDYEICVHCQRVYKIRTTAAHSCPACKGEIHTGRLYAPLTISSLINLIQDHYCMELSRTSAIGEKVVEKVVEKKEPRHYVGIILLFCTFVECWMAHFLRSLMRSRGLSEPHVDCKLFKNWTMHKRRELFMSLTAQSFDDVLKDLTEENEKKGRDYSNYQAVWSSIMDVFKIRNEAIHKGAICKISEELVDECVKNIHAINSLFVSLHNKYIAQPIDSGGGCHCS